MEEIVDLHVDFYNRLLDEADVLETLDRSQIKILDGFTNQVELVRHYFQKMYANDRKRIVFCGINPGKNGAGKTGIPFIDFKGASQLLPGINENNSERSAQFILSIIEEIGIENYHDLVYMTNLSWYGFTKDGRNLNYYKLPGSVQRTFTSSFIKEMDVVQPSLIVPLSIKVEESLKQMVENDELHYPIAPRLSHPYYSSIKANEDASRKAYLEVIRKYGNEVGMLV